MSEDHNFQENVSNPNEEPSAAPNAVPNSETAKNRKVAWWLVAGAVGALSLVAIASSGGVNGGPAYDSNAIKVEQFGCSLGTSVASAIVSNNSRQDVNAFVTVGLYSSGGTLQWSGTEYGYVEAGGKSLINVRLGGYIYTTGQCKIINSGY